MKTLTNPLARRHQRLRTDPESGTTLVELMVAMIIMVICGSIFTGAVYTLSRTSNQAQAINDASTQNNQAFQSLDKVVRSAGAISTPGTGPSGSWYVELRDTSSGSEVCTQLRLDVTTQQLGLRTWSPPATPPAAFTPIASGISNAVATAGASNQPFVLPSVAAATSAGASTLAAMPTLAATATHQQLVFTMISTAGPASQRVSSRSSFALTALNSTLPVPSGPICQQAARS